MSVRVFLLSGQALSASKKKDPHPTLSREKRERAKSRQPALHPNNAIAPHYPFKPAR
jgi:hypothetical protein